MSLDTFAVGFAVATVIVSLTAGLLHERAMRLALGAKVKRLEKLLANLERVGRNKLYREALEDERAQAVQAALRLRVAKRDLEDALRILDLDPEKDK